MIESGGSILFQNFIRQSGSLGWLFLYDNGMEFFIFCGVTYAVLYAMVVIEEHLNWMKSYRDIAKEQEFESNCENCVTEYHE